MIDNMVPRNLDDIYGPGAENADDGIDSEAKHALEPEEWTIDKDVIWGGYLNADMTHALIAQFWDNDSATANEMARFVLRACQSHKGLVEACKAMLIEMRAYAAEDEYDKGAPNKELFDMLKAALAKAGDEELLTELAEAQEQADFVERYDNT